MENLIISKGPAEAFLIKDESLKKAEAGIMAWTGCL